MKNSAQIIKQYILVELCATFTHKGIGYKVHVLVERDGKYGPLRDGWNLNQFDKVKPLGFCDGKCGGQTSSLDVICFYEKLEEAIIRSPWFEMVQTKGLQPLPVTT